MNNERLDDLKRFVREHGRSPGPVEATFERLAPFFRLADEMPFSLERADRRSIAEISSLIGRIIGREPDRLVIISLCPPDGPRTADQASAILRERLAPKIWHTLGNHLCGRYRAADREAVPPEIGRELRRLIEASLGANQLDSLVFSLRDIIGEPFVDVLQYYLTALMAGDERACGELARLAEWTPRLLPLGDHPGHPGTWYVLSA